MLLWSLIWFFVYPSSVPTVAKRDRRRFAGLHLLAQGHDGAVAAPVGRWWWGFGRDLQSPPAVHDRSVAHLGQSAARSTRPVPQSIVATRVLVAQAAAWHVGVVQAVVNPIAPDRLAAVIGAAVILIVPVHVIRRPVAGQTD